MNMVPAHQLLIDRALNHIRAFGADQKGATAIEYGLIAALVCVAIIGSLTRFSNEMTTMFNTIKDSMINARS